jgi:hypothetical protein
MLHITNGDMAVGVLRAAEFPGTFLPWRDVLHDGPVPAGLSLPQLSRVRVEFIVSCGWGKAEEAGRQFLTRDGTLDASANEDEIVLWFESDLYDQLQLCQVLAWYGDQPTKPRRLSLIGVDKGPDGVFRGLSQLKPEVIGSLFEARAPVSAAQLALAVRAWEAFRAPDPVSLDALRAKGTPALPFLAPALQRLLEELPSVSNGLSRTEHAALAGVAEGARAPAEIFVAVHTREERPFMGDWSFWRVLARLASGTKPMLELASGARPRFPPEVPAAASFGAQRFRLTPSGREVLAGKLDAIKTNGIDRWLGGTHLWQGGKLWRWNGAEGKLAGPA